MASVVATVTIRSIRKDSEDVIVDMTIDGVPHRFRFWHREGSIEVWIPGNGRDPFPYRSDPKFVAMFGSARGRRDITDLIMQWCRREPLEFPVEIVTTRRG